MRPGNSDAEKRRGFTLIELLVVISVIVLLMALLIPALSRARKQARSVVCQSHLKQWGLRVATGASEDDGSLRKWGPTGTTHEAWSFQGDVPAPESRSRDIRFCPMAGTLVTAEDEYSPNAIITSYGGTFRAWGHIFLREGISSTCGSYGSNGALNKARIGLIGSPGSPRRAPTYVRSAGRVPALLDSTWTASAGPRDGKGPDDAPPECDALPMTDYERRWRSCINRHDGGVNCLFFDGSVRKVGLKELWTLEWYPGYDTGGPWTIAGGVQPGDWPAWMQQFRDY